MISSVQAQHHHAAVTTSPAGNPNVDYDVLQDQKAELSQLIKELEKNGPSPKLLAEIKQKMSDISTELQKYVTDEKAAHGGQLDPKTQDAVNQAEENLADMTIDLNDPNPNIDAISQYDSSLNFELGQLNDR